MKVETTFNWLPTVASQWPLVPVAWLGQQTKDKNAGMRETNLLSLSYGRVIRKDISSGEGLRPASYETYQIVEPGDTILRFTDLQNDKRSLRSGLVRERGIMTSAYINFRPNTALVDPRFFALMMRTVDQKKVFYQMGSGVRQSLNYDEFSALAIPLPDLDTQHRIADYLDVETSQIDAMMAKLDEQVELLRERKDAVISSRVAPEGRRAVPLGSIASVTPGKAKNTNSGPSEGVEMRPYFRAANIQADGLLTFEMKQMPFTHVEIQKFALKAGDVLIVEGGAGYGRSTTLKEGFPGIGFQNHVLRVRPHSNYLGKFIDYTVRHHYRSGLIDVLAAGATIPGVSSDKVRSLPILHLGSNEQRRYVAELDKVTSQIDTMINKCTELRELLKERRAALITAVVTGQKEV